MGKLKQCSHQITLDDHVLGAAHVEICRVEDHVALRELERLGA